jgi:hypothetical protein
MASKGDLCGCASISRSSSSLGSLFFCPDSTYIDDVAPFNSFWENIFWEQLVEILFFTSNSLWHVNFVLPCFSLRLRRNPEYVSRTMGGIMHSIHQWRDVAYRTHKEVSLP